MARQAGPPNLCHARGSSTSPSGSPLSLCEPMPDAPNPQLPPASTTQYSVKDQGTALGAFARRRAGLAPDPARRSALDELYDDAPVIPPPHRQEPAEPKTMRLSELVEAVKRVKAHSRAMAEGQDPDGPEDHGYDPSEVVRTLPTPPGSMRGASGAAAALGYLRRTR